MSNENADERTASTEDNLHHVSTAAALDPGERVVVDIDGMEVALFNVDGEYHAMANYCVHQGGPVAEGLISGTVSCEMAEDGWDLFYDKEDQFVACPWHGWQFEIETGKHKSSTDHRIPTFDVVNLDGELYVEW